MRNNYTVYDAQQALSFVVSQVAYLEPGVYAIKYPDVQYRELVPIDTTAPEWVKSISYYTSDRVGAARWFHHEGTDMPRADVARTRYEVGVEMAGIGYGWTLEEVQQSLMVPGQNLTAERADAARRSAEEFIDDKVMTGDSGKNWKGLINNSAVTVITAPATGTGGSASWDNKTGDQIALDINSALSGLYTASKTVEMADTVLLPVGAMTTLSTKRMDTSGSSICVLDWVKNYNVYTQVTGQPLTIRAVRQLDNAASGGDAGRMVVYRRDPQVVKVHIPMMHRFMPVWQTSTLGFDVPGIFRLGPVEIRRPGAFRYVDGISDYTS